MGSRRNTMSPSSAVAGSTEWVNGVVARRMLGGMSYAALSRRCILGEIRVKLIPGLAPRYALADLERLAATLRPMSPNVP
jgi:hypothetical protein